MVEAVRMLLLSGRVQIFVFSKQSVWNGPEKSHRTADLEPLRDMAKQAVASGLLWLKSFCGSVWPKSNTMYSLIYWFCVHWEMMMNQSNAFCHSTIYCTEKIFPCIYGNFWVFSMFRAQKTVTEMWKRVEILLPTMCIQYPKFQHIHVWSVNNSGVSSLQKNCPGTELLVLIDFKAGNHARNHSHRPPLIRAMWNQMFFQKSSNIGQ